MAMQSLKQRKFEKKLSLKKDYVKYKDGIFWYYMGKNCKTIYIIIKLVSINLPSFKELVITLTK